MNVLERYKDKRVLVKLRAHSFVGNTRENDVEGILRYTKEWGGSYYLLHNNCNWSGGNGRIGNEGYEHNYVLVSHCNDEGYTYEDMRDDYFISIKGVNSIMTMKHIKTHRVT